MTRLLGRATAKLAFRMDETLKGERARLAARTAGARGQSSVGAVSYSGLWEGREGRLIRLRGAASRRWGNPRLKPKTAFSCLPSVHRSDREGQQRVALTRSPSRRMTAVCQADLGEIRLLGCFGSTVTSRIALWTSPLGADSASKVTPRKGPESTPEPICNCKRGVRFTAKSSYRGVDRPSRIGLLGALGFVSDLDLMSAV
jgi:hypothetical protein